MKCLTEGFWWSTNTGELSNWSKRKTTLLTTNSSYLNQTIVNSWCNKGTSARTVSWSKVICVTDISYWPLYYDMFPLVVCALQHPRSCLFTGAAFPSFMQCIVFGVLVSITIPCHHPILYVPGCRCAIPEHVCITIGCSPAFPRLGTSLWAVRTFLAKCICFSISGSSLRLVLML